MPIQITSPAFAAGQPIPKKHTGEGPGCLAATPLVGRARRDQGIRPDLRRSRRPDPRALGALADLQDSGRCARACPRACRASRA